MGKWSRHILSFQITTMSDMRKMFMGSENSVHSLRRILIVQTSISLESRLYPHQETKILNNFVSSNDVRFVSSLDKVRLHEDW